MSATEGIRVERHPAPAGAAVALLAAALAVGAVADAPGQLLALAAEVIALAGVASGVWRLRAGDRLVGVAVATAGGLGALAAVGYGVTAATQTTRVLEFVPGALGLGLLVLGLVPIRAGWSRVLVSAGAIAVGVGILTSGVVLDAGRLRLLAGMALLVIAWDAAEQAVNLGEQVGRGAESAAVVATHSTWSVGAGVLGVAAAVGVARLDVTGLPIVGVVLLLAGTVALAIYAFS